MVGSPPPRADLPRLCDLDLVVRTDRLILRPWTPADADAIFPIVSDPEFPRLMSWRAHASIEETLAFVAATQRGLAEDTQLAWAIERGGRPVGCISLDDLTWVLRAWRLDRAEIGYWLAPDQWGQGVMTEAGRAAMRFSFETLGLHKLEIGCLAENDRSRRVIEKCGFRFIGRREEDVWRDGAWHAALRYELTAGEWTDVYTTRPMRRR